MPAACWTQPHWKLLLSNRGAELVIHGHNHINMLAWGTGPSGRFPIVGAPSASLGARHRHEPLGRYNLYRIESAERSIACDRAAGWLSPADPWWNWSVRALVPKRPAITPPPPPPPPPRTEFSFSRVHKLYRAASPYGANCGPEMATSTDCEVAGAP